MTSARPPRRDAAENRVAILTAARAVLSRNPEAPLDEAVPVGVCGDAWGPRSRVEQAWLSGQALGEELARRLS